MKICLWGDISEALKGNTPGGAELQIALMTKAFAKSGHEVVVLDFTTNENFVTADGVKVFALKGWNQGINILKTLALRLPSLYLSLKNLKADVYYCRIRDFKHVVAYYAAKKVHAKFIIALADGLDGYSFLKRCKYLFLTHKPSFSKSLNIVLTEMIYPFLITKSDLVFTQHEDQLKIIIKQNRNCILFPNLIDLNDIPFVNDPVRKDFIYVGSLAKSKGVVELFELIRKTPICTYKIVGDPRDKTALVYYQKLEALKNVKMLGRLNHRDALYQMVNSRGLISTSPLEGFPNVFIEAWACGIPVFSLYVNPGDIINKEGIGAVGNGDIDRLIKLMAVTDNSPDLSVRSKEYVRNNHLINDIKIKEIDSILQNLFSR